MKLYFLLSPVTDRASDVRWLVSQLELCHQAVSVCPLGFVLCALQIY
jgi:hypothetical protein